MGTVKDLWPWNPVSKEWLIRLEGLKPDYAIQRAAAIEYLEHKESEPVKVTVFDQVIIPAAIILIMIALLGFSYGWAFR